jgi:hypothetical protein
VGRRSSESPLVHACAPTLRAGRYDEAIGACAAGEATLDPASEEQGRAATVLAFIRELAEAGDDETHNVAEAFAAED